MSMMYSIDDEPFLLTSLNDN